MKIIFNILKRYGIELWVIFFAANIAVIISVRIHAQTQNCMTTAQVNSDSRCLYIYNNDIYQIGSRGSPHHGHPCGMDVSNILPSSHIGRTTKYLVPNFVGSICTQTSTPTPTPTASPTVTPAPTKTPTPTPTATPTKTPTPTIAPTLAPGATPSPTPVTTPVPTPAPTKTPIATNTPTATPNIGKFGQNFTPYPATSTPSPLETPVAQIQESSYNFIYWTTIGAYISIASLFGLALYWLGTKAVIVLKYRHGKKDS